MSNVSYMLAFFPMSRLTDTTLNTIGQRETERALQLSHMYSTAEALKVGLVDEVVPPDQVLPRAEAEMKSWIAIPSKYTFYSLQ